MALNPGWTEWKQPVPNPECLEQHVLDETRGSCCRRRADLRLAET